MPINSEELRSTYEAWKRAREKFDDKMRAILDGASNEWSEVEPLISELDLTYKRFREVGDPAIKKTD